MTRLTLSPVPSRLDVAGFAAHYTSEVIRCLDAILPDMPRALPRLLDAVRGERSTIYLLGNGGSSAIARTLALTAMNLTGSAGSGVRWVGAWDSHRIAAESTIHGFDAAAVGLLARDGADHRDLVVLISGSGNSANLVAVAQHCHHHGIPLITLTGRTGGALAPFDPTGLRVDSTDQQVIEDVAHAAGLALLHLLAAQAVEPKAAYEVLQRSRPELTRALMINRPWLQSLCKATAASAGRGGRIVVLAPEGGGVALSAEHTAHNLRWDLGHDNTRARLRVVDGTSLCDDTGMSNDTGTCGLAAARLLDDITSEDLILIFADDPDHPAVRPARTAARAATAHGAAVFGFYRTGTSAGPHETAWHTGIHGPHAALTAQTVGHLLLRGVRAATLLLDDDRNFASGQQNTAWQPVAWQHARPAP